MTGRAIRPSCQEHLGIIHCIGTMRSLEDNTIFAFKKLQVERGHQGISLVRSCAQELHHHRFALEVQNNSVVKRFIKVNRAELRLDELPIQHPHSLPCEVSVKLSTFRKSNSALSQRERMGFGRASKRTWRLGSYDFPFGEGKELYSVLTQSS